MDDGTWLTEDPVWSVVKGMVTGLIVMQFYNFDACRLARRAMNEKIISFNYYFKIVV